MSWAALALGLRLTGVVDRIEGEFAVVCWDAEHQAELPLAAAPRLREGIGLVVRIRPSPDGVLALTARSVASHGGPLSLPPAARLQPGRRYRLRLRTRRVRPPPWPRATPLPGRIDLRGSGTPHDSPRSTP
jgi:hypothetical protein